MFVCGGVLVRVYTVSPNQPIRWQPANMRWSVTRSPGRHFPKSGVPTEHTTHSRPEACAIQVPDFDDPITI